MDLKASNVLLTQTYSIAKIGDVGFAQVMGSSRAGRPRPATFAYSAPELILNGACTEKVSLVCHSMTSCFNITAGHVNQQQHLSVAGRQAWNTANNPNVPVMQN